MIIVFSGTNVPTVNGRVINGSGIGKLQKFDEKKLKIAVMLIR